MVKNNRRYIKIKDIVQEIEKGNITLAEFQRTYKWHKTESPKSLLESFQNGIFVMPIILGRINDKIYIIDGQQRALTLFCFLKGYVPKIEEAKWSDVINAIKNNENINLNYYEPCPWIFDKNIIMEKSIGYSYIFNVNTSEGEGDSEKIMEFFVTMFHRINSQGIALENHELRHAFYYLSANLKTLRELKWEITAANSYIDPIRYIPLLYKKIELTINQNLAVGYFSRGGDKDLNDYYLDWIEYIISGKTGSTIFPSNISITLMPNVVTKIEKALEILNICGIKINHSFSNKAECDLCLFGLLQLLYENKTINTITLTQTVIDDFLRGTTKENDTQEKILSRMKKSYEFYKEYTND